MWIQEAFFPAPWLLKFDLVGRREKKNFLMWFFSWLLFAWKKLKRLHNGWLPLVLHVAGTTATTIKALTGKLAAILAAAAVAATATTIGKGRCSKRCKTTTTHGRSWARESYFTLFSIIVLLLLFSNEMMAPPVPMAWQVTSYNYVVNLITHCEAFK